jgi:DNA replication protein DnaD
MLYTNGRFCVIPIKECEGWHPSELSLFVWLSFYANKKTGICIPSLQTLAKKCGLSKSSIIRTLPKLKKRGVIKIVKRRQANRQSYDSNEYHLQPPYFQPHNT